MYNEASDTEMYSAFGNALELARTFSSWEWTERELPIYSNVIKTLHTDITKANLSIIDSRVRPIRPFDASNAVKRFIMFRQILSIVMNSKGQRQNAAMRRLLRRYQPIFYLASAIYQYSWGVSRLLSEGFAEKWPYKKGLSNSEGALLDFYAAKRALDEHLKFQSDFDGHVEYARRIGKIGQLQAYATHHSPVRERAICLVRGMILGFLDGEQYSINDLAHAVIAELYLEFPDRVFVPNTIKKWIKPEIPSDKLKGPGRPKNKR